MPVKKPPRVGENTFRVGVFGKPLKRLSRATRVEIRIETRIFDGIGMPFDTESRWLVLTAKRPLRSDR